MAEPCSRTCVWNPPSLSPWVKAVGHRTSAVPVVLGSHLQPVEISYPVFWSNLIFRFKIGRNIFGEICTISDSDANRALAILNACLPGPGDSDPAHRVPWFQMRWFQLSSTAPLVGVRTVTLPFVKEKNGDRFNRYIIITDVHNFLLLIDIDALNPELIISLDENSYIKVYTLRRVHRSLHYISQGVDAPQCICKALQNRFAFPRTVISL